MVWVNLDSKRYHKETSAWYGKTKNGKYMSEADAIKAGYRAANMRTKRADRNRSLERSSGSDRLCPTKVDSGPLFLFPLVQFEDFRIFNEQAIISVAV